MAESILPTMMRYWLLLASLFICLRGHASTIEEELGVNRTALRELLELESDPFIQDLQGHWSFNDTSDISKYEEFDHTRFQGRRELSLEELVEKVRALEKLKKRRRPDSTARPTLVVPPTGEPTGEATVVVTGPTNLTGLLGGVAFLPCRVLNINNPAVVWVRKRDLHILTSGRTTYTNDERFQALHAEGSPEWLLQIRYLQARDAGEYECQVWTGQGKLEHRANLTVLEPSLAIVGAAEQHVDYGSDISLVCVVSNSRVEGDAVRWFHENNLLGGSAATAGQQDSKLLGKVLVKWRKLDGEGRSESRLFISRATARHSGNYTCAAGAATPVSVNVFVSSDGDQTAAIQGGSSGVEAGSPPLLLILFSALVNYQWYCFNILS